MTLARRALHRVSLAIHHRRPSAQSAARGVAVPRGPLADQAGQARRRAATSSRRARRLEPSVGTLLNLGDCRERHGQTRDRVGRVPQGRGAREAERQRREARCARPAGARSASSRSSPSPARSRSPKATRDGIIIKRNGETLDRRRDRHRGAGRSGQVRDHRRGAGLQAVEARRVAVGPAASARSRSRRWTATRR